MWFEIVGIIVGWLHDDEGVDQETMVVRTADGHIWLRPTANDFETDNPGKDQVSVGDSVKFMTNWDEQEQYSR